MVVPFLQSENDLLGASYAIALVELAQESNTLEAVHADMDALASILKVRQHIRPHFSDNPEPRLHVGVCTCVHVSDIRHLPALSVESNPSIANYASLSLQPVTLESST